MLKILFNHKARALSVLVLILLLALTRAYETTLFYDPFLEYFKEDFNALPLPEYRTLPLFLSLLFRYALNMLLSLGIIYALFQEIEMIKFATFLYLFFFLMLIVAFFSVLFLYDEPHNFLLFYIRRFLIQPVFVILFVPAFYFQKKQNKK